jgi:hypothetical protein
MSISDVLEDPRPQLGERLSRRRTIGEKNFVDVLTRVPPDPAYRDVSSVLVPFEDRSGTDAELATNLGRNGDLPLGRDA